MAEHDQRLHAVFERLSQNITLNPSKCVLAAKEINFLGHRVSADGVKPTLDNIDAIQKLQTPTNVTELASFLGSCNFYLKFVPHYADVAEPLSASTPPVSAKLSPASTHVNIGTFTCMVGLSPCAPITKP